MTLLWRRLLWAALVLGTACSSWASGPQGDSSGAIRGVHDVPYSEAALLDVYAPADAHAAPVLVLLHGCCGDRRDLTQFARGLAAEGAVVFNASWRKIPSGGRYPAVYHEAACAVRFARAEAPKYGGDPRTLTLVGWSDGALLGAVIAQAGDDFRDGCSAAISALPDAFVGVGAFLGWPVDPSGAVDPRYVNDRTKDFFGGDPQAAPSAWRGASPYTYLHRRPGLAISLVVGADDELLGDNVRFAIAARAAGEQVDLSVVPAAGHLDLLAPSTAKGATAVRHVLRTAMVHRR